MYKTVRHGENSLQYTILPQNDDFRIEGKLSSASSASGNAANGGRKCKAKRPKRRSFFAYLGLIFVCTVIVGAVLIPFLVSAECLPNPTEWFLKTKAAFTKGGSVNALHRGNSAEPRDTAAGKNALSRSQHAQAQAHSANIGKTVHIINRDGIEKIVLRVNKTTPTARTNNNSNESVNVFNGGVMQDQHEGDTVAENSNPALAVAMETDAKNSDTAVPTLPSSIHEQVNAQPAANQLNPADNFVAEVRFEPSDMNPMAAIAPTIVVTTVRNQYAAADRNNKYDNNNSNNNFLKSDNQIGSQKTQQNAATTAIRPTSSLSTTSIYSPHAPAYAANANQPVNNASAVPTIMTRIMQSPLLKAAAKKPIIPPVLVRTNLELLPPSKAQVDDISPGGVVTDATGNNSVAIDAAPVATPANVNNEISGEDSKDVAGRKDWIQTHWPYIDPSTYFQWTGYKEDSVLLPALLGFALIGMILIITVCLVARNKRAIVSSVRKRNRNDVEATGAEDNATLLTNANLSDED